MEGDSFMRTVGRMKMLLLWRSLDASSFVSSYAHCHCDTGELGGLFLEGRYCIDTCFHLIQYSSS